MPGRLHRYQKTGRSHFVTFGCYRRRKGFASASRCELFLVCLEEMRQRFEMRIYGYVVMPEHVHLLVSEPETGMLAEAVHFLKLSFAKRVRKAERLGFECEERAQGVNPRLAPKEQARTWGTSMTRTWGTSMTRTSGTSVTGTWGTGSFWEKRYHDRNVRDELEFRIKLRYLHRNPVERGLVESPAKWKWSSYRHYAMREVGVVEIATEWMAEKDPKGIVECP